MIDRLFLTALTFCLLAAGTLAIGTALLEGKRPAQAQAQAHTQAPPRVVQLPMVEVIGKRVDNGTALARTEGDEAAANKLQ